MEAIKGFKTIAFNAVMVVVAMVHALNPDAELPTGEAVQAGVDTFWVGLSAVWGLGSVILRAVTNSSVFKRTSPAPMPPAAGGGR